jgi:hypothetical protein
MPIGHALGGNCGSQPPVIAFGLVTMSLGEFGYGLVEPVRAAEVGGEPDARRGVSHSRPSWVGLPLSVSPHFGRYRRSPVSR